MGASGRNPAEEGWFIPVVTASGIFIMMLAFSPLLFKVYRMYFPDAETRKEMDIQQVT
jgi:hypothetical protein